MKRRHEGGLNRGPLTSVEISVQPFLELEGVKVQGEFLSRLNRFAAAVLLAGEERMAHLPNSGRMQEPLVPGRPTLLSERQGRSRKTRYDMLMVYVDGLWVSVDSRLPSPLLRWALEMGALPQFSGYQEVFPEFSWGRSRIDFLLRGTTGDCLVEAKSVNLVREGRALFPDAPTQRGTKHLRALMEALDGGYEAAVIFVVQRADAQSFSPYEWADPLFTRTLREAAEKGVQLYAYRCCVSPAGIALDGEIPVLL